MNFIRCLLKNIQCDTSVIPWQAAYDPQIKEKKACVLNEETIDGTKWSEFWKGGLHITEKTSKDKFKKQATISIPRVITQYSSRNAGTIIMLCWILGIGNTLYIIPDLMYWETLRRLSKNGTWCRIENSLITTEWTHLRIC